MSDPGNVNPYNAKRIAQCMDYAIRHMWKPRFADGHPRTKPFQITMNSCGVPNIMAPWKREPSNSFGLHPVAESASGANPVTKTQPPHPDDYRFEDSELYLCDWVQNYDICLSCVNCKKADKLFPSVWTHSAAAQAAAPLRRGTPGVKKLATMYLD